LDSPLHGADEEEWTEIPAGPFAMGCDGTGFSYDNERPRHAVEVPAFRIARHPVTNASWMRFSEGGGYERREWWSDEGWAWKEEHDITHHHGVAAGHPRAPACHVSWFEADAFARAHGARLPSEAEWEKAATWAQERDGPHRTLAASGAGDGKAGALGGVWRVWEWTQSHFRGYPGFVAHPYREYSEVFFGQGYRVLRGGSWATSRRVATSTFRNWDLPERRQIFAGVRLAKDAA
jgi:iron(II)-dependent oxidoreductase